ncbi:hypothetical protein [Pseudomonas sp. PH1b]|uniref:hypothetical protein n=1 Tax=Pseudomonas sp. PH1b TaxID=1397282 RepID=UPI000B178C05|nr:hypothetical protein [Pseudomonas sp. PH1b]
MTARTEGKVELRVQLYDGEDVRFGVPVQFRPVTESLDDSAGRRGDGKRKMITSIAPISMNSDMYTRVSLDIGEYDIEAILPSGEHLSAEVDVKPGKTHKVVLIGCDTSTNFNNGSNFVGRGSPPRKRPRKSLDEPNHELHRELKVSVGSMLVSKSTQSIFDPSKWSDWFQLLMKRYQHREDVNVDIFSLRESEAGLTVQQEEGADGLSARISLISQERRQFHSIHVGGKRVYVEISSAYELRIVSLPWPWGEFGTRPGSKKFEIIAQTNGERLHCTPLLIDARWGSLLAYMSSGRLYLASEIIKQAKDALFGKSENPLAAAVGGYILMSTEQDDEAENWPWWLSNLSERFPEFPDGAILRARWLLRKGGMENISKAHDLLYDSIQRGIPFFTIGVTWLIEGLEQTSIGCSICDEYLKMIRGVARSVDLEQAFTSFIIPQCRPDGSSAPYNRKKPAINKSLNLAPAQTKRLNKQESFGIKIPKHSLSLPLLRG